MHDRQKWASALGIKPAKPTKMQHESMLQQSCVEWFRYQYPRYKLVSIPNGAHLHGDEIQSANQWARLEAEGADPGASDLFLFVARGGWHGLCLEMKWGKNKQSPKQIEFEESVTVQHYKYVLCYTFEEFQNQINDYLHT